MRYAAVAEFPLWLGPSDTLHCAGVSITLPATAAFTEFKTRADLAAYINGKLLEEPNGQKEA